MKASQLPAIGEPLPKGPVPWQTQPMKYKKPPINEKVAPKPTPKTLPRHLAWGEVKRGEYPHKEKTICCDQGCRIHDIIIMVPILAFNEVKDQALVHAGCLRKFLEGVPSDFDAVQEVVSHIMERFVDLDD